MRIWFFIVALVGFWTTQAYAGYFGETSGDEFLRVQEAFQPSLTREGDRLELTWRIAPGYYLYKDKFKFIAQLEGGEQLLLTPVAINPAPVQRHDEFFGDVLTFEGVVDIRFDLGAKLAESTHIEVRYQGCATAGICYPPSKAILAIPEKNS